MGALFGGTTKTVQNAEKTVQQTVPEPEQTAEPTQVGQSRKAEDEALFGSSQPDLRVDRPSVPTSVGTAGSGLKLM